MKALIVDGEGRLSVEEISMPQIGPCQALVKMERGTKVWEKW